MINQDQLFDELGLPPSPQHDDDQFQLHNSYEPVQYQHQFNYEEYDQNQNWNDNQHVQGKKKQIELTVQISENFWDVIIVHEHDDPVALANDFVYKHNLKPAAAEYIYEQIMLTRSEQQQNKRYQRDRNNDHERLSPGKENKNHQTETEPYRHLYKEAEVKRNKQLQREIDDYCKQVKANSIHNQSVTGRTQLYQRTLRQKEEKERRIEEQRKQNEKDMLKGHSFKPQISQKSLKIVEKRKSQISTQKTEDQLISDGLKIKDKKTINDYLHQKTEEQRYSFKPEVNKISEKIVQTKRSLTPRPEKAKDKNTELYQKSFEVIKKREKNAEKTIQQSCTFKPKINQGRSHSTYVPFLERIHHEISKRKERLRQEEMALQYDPKNGQKLFNPKICRAPKFQRKSDDMAIGDYLFQQKTRDESIIIYPEEVSVTQRLQPSKSSEKSTTIVENLKKKKLIEYFMQMDGDNDGFISAEKVNIENLPTEALELFAPIFVQLEQVGVQMNQEKWIEKATAHFNKLSVNEKSLILKRNKPPATEDHTFRPNLNQKSIRLAEKTRSYSGHEGLYLHSQKQLVTKDLKQQLHHQYKRDDEKSACTFRPFVGNREYSIY